jgi:protein-tyrosine phosphatase
MEALGKLNFRDLGGMAATGGTLRRGVLYRSEGPASFGEGHRAELAAIGFRAVCDLRSAVEQKHAPNDWAAGARLISLDIVADLRAQSPSAGAPRDTGSGEAARETMLRNYRAMPAAILPHLAGLVDMLAEGETPVLMHCTAGKDRTGVLVALLLLLLGVSRDQVRRDYLLSESFLKRPGATADLGRRLEAMQGRAPDAATMQALAGVDPAYLDAAIEAVEDGWGSLDDYYAATGISSTRRQAFAAAVIDA